ncbi:hypothetical protein [Amycolatopsis sp. NPDC102389]|uniref:hypothetical protein n=1 Tax=Amycolatopsis sp. NPDC102389 TaxID=3363941 RepID=UPI003830A738
MTLFGFVRYVFAGPPQEISDSRSQLQSNLFGFEAMSSFDVAGKPAAGTAMA